MLGSKLIHVSKRGPWRSYIYISLDWVVIGLCNSLPPIIHRQGSFCVCDQTMRRYIVTLPLIGWAHTQNDLCIKPLPEPMLIFFAICTLRNKLPWNLNKITEHFFQENAFDKFVCKTAAILFRLLNLFTVHAGNLSHTNFIHFKAACKHFNILTLSVNVKTSIKSFHLHYLKWEQRTISKMCTSC